MRSTFAAVLALATSVLAQWPNTTPGYAVISNPGDNDVVPAGKTFTVKWDAGKFTGPATLSLLGGASPSTLQVLSTLDSIKVQAGSYAWAVDCSLGADKTYGIEIASTADDGHTFQYSFPFSIKACDSTASSSSSLQPSHSTTASTTGYPVQSISTVSANATETSHSASATSATSAISTKAISTKAAHSTTAATTTFTTLVTWSSSPNATYPTKTPAGVSAPVTTPVTLTTSGSATPTSSIPSSTVAPATGGAARVGAGFAAIGLFAAALAL